MTSINSWFSKNQDIVFVVTLLLTTVIIFIPLPPMLIDLLLIISISLALLIILTVTYVRHPLDFSVFPSVLLTITVFRLALNIATTRLILSNPPTSVAPAGYVIQTFGEFVGGSNAIIGFIIFIIITIIQFVVITKGATRISEVAARFTLDAMPGKQMSIDADLNAGLITEDEARRRREAIMREADFYGAMDGATKFVRGDAIAGILITIINLLGGFAIGWLQYSLPIDRSMKTYSIMTIGDGLASQIPALLVSLAAGLLVTRSTAKAQLGEEVIGQLFKDTKPVIISAVFLAFLMATPLPKLPLLAAGGVLALIYTQLKKAKDVAQKKELIEKEKESRKPEKVESLLAIDPVSIEVGYALIKLVDPAEGGVVLDKITRIRRQLATELGIVVPPIRVRDNLSLEHNVYTIKIRGVKVAQAKLMPDLIMALNPGTAKKKIPKAIEAKDPTFDMEAYWIEPDQKDFAEENGYTTVDPPTIMATHLSETLKKHAPELLTREDLTTLLKALKETHPSLVEEVIGNDKPVTKDHLQKVLRNLLREGLSIRDLPLIIEAIASVASRAKGDIEILTEHARQALARQITEQYKSSDGKVYAITLDPKVEDVIRSASQHTEGGYVVNLPPNTLKKLADVISDIIREARLRYSSVVLLVQPQIRPQMKRLVDAIMPGVPAVSYNELMPDTMIEVVSSVQEK